MYGGAVSVQTAEIPEQQCAPCHTSVDRLSPVKLVPKFGVNVVKGMGQ